MGNVLNSLVVPYKKSEFKIKTFFLFGSTFCQTMIKWEGTL